MATYCVVSYGVIGVLLPPMINIVVLGFPLYFMRKTILKYMTVIAIRSVN